MVRQGGETGGPGLAWGRRVWGGARTILGNACSPGQEAGLEKRTRDLNIPSGAHAAEVWSYDGVRGEKLGTSSRRLQSKGGDASWPGVCSFPPLLGPIFLTGGRLHADWGSCQRLDIGKALALCQHLS